MENIKMIDTKLSGIQSIIDETGNKLFGQNEELGKSLKLCAFELGMVRAMLGKSATESERKTHHTTNQG
jgi:hypothetical protein